MNPDELWAAVLDRARQSFSTFVVQIWFVLPITPLEIDAEGKLICKVDDRHFGWIEKKYGEWLGQVVRELGANGLILERVPA